MRIRALGSTGLKVSELCFGTMTFGGTGYWGRIGQNTQEDANRLISMAIDGGVNFFDTADIYSDGISEQFLGKALGANRRHIVLATKVRGRMGPGPNDVGLSRHHIIEGCNASLRRLGTDYIDLYQVHNWDHCTPLEETLGALNDLVRSGKVRYIGCSNFTGWQIQKAAAISVERGWSSFVTAQMYYSLVCRDIEYEVVPACLDRGLGVLPWSPLAGGFLTGKYRRGQPRPQGTRRSDPEGNFLRFNEEHGFIIIDELERIARQHDTNIPQVALNYLLRRPGVSSIVVGARSTDQLSSILGASDWEMSAEEVNALDGLTSPATAYPYWMQEFGKRDR